jgi:hypothetical protein
MGAPSAARNPSLLRREFNRIVGAIDNDKQWSFHLARALHRAVRVDRPDIIITSGPPFSGVFAGTYCAKRNAIPLVMDFRDPWHLPLTDRPQLYDGFRDRVDRALEAWCVQNASRITVTSRALAVLLADRYESRSERICIIRNGFEDEQRIVQPPPQGCLHMLYAGTLYLNRDPFPFLEALNMLVNDSRVDRCRVRMTFVGDCDSWQERSVSQWVESKALNDVISVAGMVPPDEVARLTERSNVLITLAQRQPLSVPGKIFEQVASLRKLLIFTEPDSETANTVRGLPQAIVVTEDEPQGVFQRLLALYGDMMTAREFSERPAAAIESYSRTRTNVELERVLREALI